MAYKSSEHKRAAQKQYYKENKTRCNDLSRKWYEKNKARIRARYENDHEYRNSILEKRRAHRREIRETVLGTYGPNCACCGEDRYELLAIDHIANNGSYERNQLGRKGGEAFYTWLIAQNFPKGYQVLCHGCNMAKGFYGRCPHETVVRNFIREGLGLQVDL